MNGYIGSRGNATIHATLPGGDKSNFVEVGITVAKHVDEKTLQYYIHVISISRNALNDEDPNLWVGQFIKVDHRKGIFSNEPFDYEKIGILKSNERGHVELLECTFMYDNLNHEQRSSFSRAVKSGVSLEDAYTLATL